MAYFDSLASMEEDFDELSNEKDFLVALQLQNHFDKEEKENEGQLDKITQIHPMNLVDKQWELIDPHPNIHTLFQQFNHQFFYGKLDSVYVEWSKRMTRCAGICYYRRGGECRIALSASYLTLRPRKDLVETLLHEMIHAYLFVTHNNKDRDGHGPEFLKHMVRINDTTGTNITVYHSFHDEYDHLHGHWWRCTGACRQWKPFYGYVKRSMNRAPSNRDRWWSEHEKRCSGQFEKIKEPEDYKTKGNKKRNANEITSNKNEQQASTSQISSPSKKKKKPNTSVPSNQGTIHNFFKKTNSTSSLTDIKQSDSKKIIEINSEKQCTITTSSNDEAKPNYAKCPICQILLPKANLFIHQIRCYKK
ncbi:unnamed protein product [Adineta steineri]|uniref:SprT-like domain-containing protein n=1 Tax=Adineta steineri TaxID=433720 RepID=A0A813P8Z4_9BILA|nr:unnamed protein product [Adineta steineri]